MLGNLFQDCSVLPRREEVELITSHVVVILGIAVIAISLMKWGEMKEGDYDDDDDNDNRANY